MVPRNFQIPFNSNKFQILLINIIKLSKPPSNRHLPNICVFWLLCHSPSLKNKKFSPRWFPSYVEICIKFFFLWPHHDWSLKIISHIVWPKSSVKSPIPCSSERFWSISQIHVTISRLSHFLPVLVYVRNTYFCGVAAWILRLMCISPLQKKLLLKTAMTQLNEWMITTFEWIKP